MDKKEIAKEKARARRLMDGYKLTPELYDAIEKWQGGVCYTCGQPEPVAGRRLSVDHNHDTGEVRGLLCSRCNPVIGKLERAFKRYGLHKAGVVFEEFIEHMSWYLKDGGWIVEKALGRRHFGYKGHVGTKAHRARIKKGRLNVVRSDAAR